MAKYYYNGVLLPEIPADVLAGYPYAWIRKNLTTGYYDVVFSALQPWYDQTGPGVRYGTSTGAVTYYQILISSAEDATEWTFNSTKNTWFGLDANRTILWSNHNIPNGSATATDIYFYGTEPVAEDSPDQLMEYLQSSGTQYFNTGVIPDSTTEIEMRYSVQKWATYGPHMLSTSGIYFPFPRPMGSSYAFCTYRFGGEFYSVPGITPDLNTVYTIRAFPDDDIIINDTSYTAPASGSKSETKPLYMFTYGGNPGHAYYTASVRVYYCKIWQGGILVRDFIPLWRSGVSGMYDKVGRKFYQSEGTSAFFAGPILGPMYDKRYLIRSGSTLYTVADGALSALAETDVSASLFQTYGVDDLPDGSLLVGLTDPEVLYWQDSTDDLPTLTMTVKGTPPLPQIFTSEPMDLTHESIAGIDHAVVDASEDVRFAVSFDSGTTWKAHDGSTWFDTSDTAPGMLSSTMNAITAEQWAEVVVLDSYMVRFWLPNVTAYVKSVVVYYINP